MKAHFRTLSPTTPGERCMRPTLAIALKAYVLRFAVGNGDSQTRSQDLEGGDAR